MDKPKVTPKDFFLWVAAMIFLYVAVFNYIALLWDYINYAIPDPLQYYSSDPYQSGISWEMAILIVLVPAFLILMWFIRRDIGKDVSRREIWVRRWALFLTLFVAGVTILGDLVYVLYAFLNGTDLTAHVLLKALVVLLVAAIGFMHFLADLNNYWEKFPARNRYVGAATAILVVLTIIAGFFIVGTPAAARLHRVDDQKVNDLTNIQYQIVNFWQQKSKLPASLVELKDPLNGNIIPLDPQTGEAYGYEVIGNLSFKLCTSFNAEGQNNTNGVSRPMPTPLGATSAKGADLEQSSWQHGAGETCFERTIDPERYPPYPKQKSL